jgi:hypothetical protein
MATRIKTALKRSARKAAGMSPGVAAGIVIGLVAGLMLFVGSASAQDGVKPLVSEKIRVDSRNGRVLVRLTFANLCDQVVYLPRALAAEKELSGALFEIRDSSNGDPLDYVGPTVKHAPLASEDFIALAPHAVHHHTIDISKHYGFLEGRHTYELNHAGVYSPDPAKPESIAALVPEEVMFSVVR